MSFKNFIEGQWVEAPSAATYEKRNPADGREVVGLFPDSSDEDIDRAVRAALKAFDSWRRVPAPRRAEILYRTGELLTARQEEIARDMTREMGKILIEARGDVQEAIDMAYWMAGEGRRLYGHTTPSELPDKFCMSVRVPIGACGLITPWNFPVAIPSWKMFPALVAGNTCVLKPSPETPRSAVHLVQALEDAGLPPGVVNLVLGTSPRLGEALVEHEGVQVVSFTGSTRTGRLVAEKCARSFKRHHLEMGGKNAIIVMDDADLDLAVDGALWGAFGTTGQRCTAASRLIVHKEIYRDFAKRFVKRARTLRVGNGLEPETEMGPLISRRQMESVLAWIGTGREEGAKLAWGGKVLTKGDYGHGHFMQPTVFADVDARMKIAQEEIFGPVVCIIPCSSFEEAVDFANCVRYGLSSAIYTRDVTRAFRALQDLTTGILYVNSPTIGAEIHLPFGGTKETGNGHREASEAALEVFTEWKAVYVDYSGRLQRAQID